MLLFGTQVWCAIQHHRIGLGNSLTHHRRVHWWHDLWGVLGIPPHCGLGSADPPHRSHPQFSQQPSSLIMPWPGKCPYCNEVMTTRRGPSEVTNDHIIPLNKGGDTNDANTIYVCQKCNNVKSNHLPCDPEWGNDPRRVIITNRVLKIIFDRKLAYPWEKHVKDLKIDKQDAS